MAKEPVIAAAVGTASHSSSPNLAKAIEAAMSKAVEDAMADGIHDPDEQRARMLAARADVVAAARQAGNEASAAVSQGDTE